MNHLKKSSQKQIGRLKRSLSYTKQRSQNRPPMRKAAILARQRIKAIYRMEPKTSIYGFGIRKKSRRRLYLSRKQGPYRSNSLASVRRSSSLASVRCSSSFSINLSSSSYSRSTTPVRSRSHSRSSEQKNEMSKHQEEEPTNNDKAQTSKNYPSRSISPM